MEIMQILFCAIKFTRLNLWSKNNKINFKNLFNSFAVKFLKKSKHIFSQNY